MNVIISYKKKKETLLPKDKEKKKSEKEKEKTPIQNEQYQSNYRKIYNNHYSKNSHGRHS